MALDGALLTRLRPLRLPATCVEPQQLPRGAAFKLHAGSTPTWGAGGAPPCPESVGEHVVQSRFAPAGR